MLRETAALLAAAAVSLLRQSQTTTSALEPKLEYSFHPNLKSLKEHAGILKEEILLLVIYADDKPD